ncbi:hypothetical protein [Deinococcus aquatilis]|uniref:hypothetical protein n=1 Tax=Deinococcus aquatilis TaxID=519440 RepID=UPI00036444CF|nr:hypothetical protein [Deinococcus aquatilis]
MAEPALTGLLALGTATLLYLVTEELLISVHDHEVEETPVVTLTFFIGLLVVFAVQFLV